MLGLRPPHSRGSLCSSSWMPSSFVPDLNREPWTKRDPRRGGCYCLDCGTIGCSCSWSERVCVGEEEEHRGSEPILPGTRPSFVLDVPCDQGIFCYPKDSSVGLVVGGGVLGCDGCFRPRDPKRSVRHLVVLDGGGCYLPANQNQTTCCGRVVCATIDVPNEMTIPICFG